MSDNDVYVLGDKQWGYMDVVEYEGNDNILEMARADSILIVQEDLGAAGRRSTLKALIKDDDVITRVRRKSVSILAEARRKGMHEEKEAKRKNMTEEEKEDLTESDESEPPPDSAGFRPLASLPICLPAFLLTSLPPSLPP